MTGRATERATTRWFSDLEEAQLRRLVYRAFALREGRDPAAYREAVRVIED